MTTAALSALGVAIASIHPKLRGVGAALAAGTVADIGTEAAQAFLLSGPDQTLGFLAHSQLAGNFQDYIFALGGSVLWAGRNRPPREVAMLPNDDRSATDH